MEVMGDLDKLFFWKGGDKTLTEMKWIKKGEKLEQNESSSFQEFYNKGQQTKEM